MKLELLFVNPPIYDFTAYDFWLRPYGLLGVAGKLSSHRSRLFDFLAGGERVSAARDGRGRFRRENAAAPEALKDIPRPYHRYGAPAAEFERFLEGSPRFDAVLVGCGMTYWYLGVKEVVEAVRKFQPGARIVLGGIYPTLMFDHASGLGADLVVRGGDLGPLASFLGTEIGDGPPSWDLDAGGSSGVVSISGGCPFSCTYCATHSIDERFEFKGEGALKKEVAALLCAGKKDIAFYDDALLYRFDEGLEKFLRVAEGKGFAFHTPNGLHARYIDRRVAGALKEAGFKTLFISLEALDPSWLEGSGNKLDKGHFESAVEALRVAGFGDGSLCSYILMGHPDIGPEAVKEAVLYLNKLGVRPYLCEFSPLPSTPDGRKCAPFGDLAEPLNHNKAAFTLRHLGEKSYQELKAFAREVIRDPSGLL